MKTIGVLGGVGPQATMDFEVHLHQASLRLIPPDRNGGYPPMVVYYLRHPPLLLKDDGTPQLPPQPDPRLLEAVRKLGGLADFLAISCNGVHRFQPEIEQASGRKVVSMIEATLAEVWRRGWKRVGVLGMGEPVVYTQPLGQMGIECETLNAISRAPLDEAIFRVMEGRIGVKELEVGRRAVAELMARGVDGVILGCTEIPFLVPEALRDENLINPIPLLAEAAVRAAMA